MGIQFSACHLLNTCHHVQNTIGILLTVDDTYDWLDERLWLAGMNEVADIVV
jgi:hypothetical protein